LAGRIDDAARRLHGKLVGIDVDRLDVSDYVSSYFKAHMRHALPSLQLYSHVLFLSLRGIPEGANLAFVDYGGGPGLLSLLAREAGVANVTYNDIYDVSCADARTLAVHVGLEADHYVLGDIGDLTKYVHEHDFSIRSIASFDVIEHIYDIDAYLDAVSRVSAGPLRVVFASTANTFNPLLRWLGARRQRMVESTDREAAAGQKLRDTVRAYGAVRVEMIRSHAPTLPNDVVQALGSATRGLIRSDIETAVDRYLASGVMPAKPSHPTNTCDPYTGNWCERLMDPSVLARSLASGGIPTKVGFGYWGDYSQRWKGFALRIVNRVIGMAGARGRHLAPYYVLYGDRA
jgi:2-polyprenyl-3-methyl-5-hydroxy-6-metoxy-1,4-benzoquinol methylase